MTLDTWRRACDDEERTLASIGRLDDHPLFEMTYYGPIPPVWIRRAVPGTEEPDPGGPAQPGCSIFAAFDLDGNPIVGRNFDYRQAPALVLRARPPDGYASIAFIDTADLEITEHMFDDVDDPDSRKALLSAPLLPLDGMNEHGLVVAMAAVPEWDLLRRPRRPIGTSVAVLRPVLDHARTVDEAVAILGHYNIDPDDGPPIHYLFADKHGDSAVAEFLGGEMRVLRREGRPWQYMVNFNLSTATTEVEAGDWRWCEGSRMLGELGGTVGVSDAFAVLAAVQQEDTQWSAVYELAKLEVHAATGRRFGVIHDFVLH